MLGKCGKGAERKGMFFLLFKLFACIDWVIFHAFVVVCWHFSKLNFSKKFFQVFPIRVSNGLGPDWVQIVCKYYDTAGRETYSWCDQSMKWIPYYAPYVTNPCKEYPNAPGVIIPCNGYPILLMINSCNEYYAPGVIIPCNEYPILLMINSCNEYPMLLMLLYRVMNTPYSWWSIHVMNTLCSWCYYTM